MSLEKVLAKIDTVAQDVQGLKAENLAIKEDNAKLRQVIEAKSRPDYGNGSPEHVFGSKGFPHIRRGENPLTSRGYSLLRLAGAQRSGDWSNASIEKGVHDRLHKACVSDAGPNALQMKRVHGSALVPLGMDYLPDHTRYEKEWTEVKGLMLLGAADADPDEIRWLAHKFYTPPGQKTAQSWLDETLGGSLVAPPQMGELIELLRNKEALVNAGAQTVPLPPQGRVVYPRQTSPTTGTFIGENTAVNLTNFQTGQLTLTPKKCAAYLQLPNELIRFANPSAEALVRSDLTKTLALTMDYYGLVGPGTDVAPLGVLNTDGVTSVACSTQTANGDTFLMQDVYSMQSAVENNNAEFEGFIMRPSSFYSMLQIRVNQGGGSATGQFGFSPFRDLSTKMTRVVNGYPATLTPQVGANRIKGSASNLTYLVGGMWSDMLIGVFGAIEFTATNASDGAFVNDQTWIRAILFGDTGLRHPGAFAYIDNIAAFSA